MKRSELIRIGRAAIEPNKLPRKFERSILLSANDRNMLTNLILNAFEQAGMLPPDVSVLEHYGKIILKDNVWEPEDD